MFKKLNHLLVLFSACSIALVINSCKKDSHTDQQSTVSNPAVLQAKTWYENTYPGNKNSTGQQITNTAGNDIDYSRLIKPDWQHGSNYTRFNKKVIELP
jgi:hypothetical protein